LYVNGNNWNDNNNGYAPGMVLASRHLNMKTYRNLYNRLCEFKSILLAYDKARKGKTRKKNVRAFHKDYLIRLLHLSSELKNKTYKPKPLTRFIIKDPKTRVIHSSDFRDRIVHHLIIMFLGPIFEQNFIYDSCANIIGKGSLFAINRFDKFKRIVTNNLHSEAFCLKADIRHYFEEVDHETLLIILKRKIKDDNLIWLIEQVLNNSATHSGGANGFLLQRHASWQLNFAILC